MLVSKTNFVRSGKVCKMKSKVHSSRKSHLQSYREGKVMKVKHHDHHSEHESSEVVAYLNELQRLVPFMPKNKKLSKLEVISNVIEYIHDLREILGLPTCDANCDLESAAPLDQAENRKLPSNNKVESIDTASSKPSMLPVVTCRSPLIQQTTSRQCMQPLQVISHLN